MPIMSASAETILNVAMIGASAGGIESLTEFLSHLPSKTENLAILIAQHLSPEHPSQLAKLLGPTTDWPVLDIQEKMPLEAGKVYVVPPNKDASFSKRRFRLMPSPGGYGPKPSVEKFFRQLVLQPDLNPIAIILSGTGTDGSLGLAPIKLAGGWTFAQTPESAPFNGMPLAAIQTGFIDYVLTPAQMGPKIQQLILEAGQASVTELCDRPSEILPELLNLLAQRSGTDFSHYKVSTILRRIEHRQMLLNLSDLPAYLDWVRHHPQELDVLFQALLIGVTGFFRDPEVFACLEPYLEQRLLHKAPGDALRIWVPGCSTGEEAYTLAIMVHRLLENHELKTPLQIFATDLDPQALAYARAGCYSQKALEHLSPELCKSYFTQTEDQFLLSKSLRNNVLFSQHDLTVNPPFLKLDLISCRNLMIYLGPGIQKSILPTFHTALNPEGLLLLGKSENVGAAHGLFKALHSPFKIYISTSSDQKPLSHFQGLSVSQSIKPNVPPLQDSEALRHKAMNKMLAEVFPHPCVLINQACELLQVSGDISPFLNVTQALVNHHLLDICRPELKLEIRSLIVQAQHEGRAISGGFCRVSEAAELIRIHVHPGSREGQLQTLVVFESVVLPLAETDSQETVALERIAELEMDRVVREARMEALLEQLDFAHQHQQVLNEELQSANEELQVANEELITSNEELQASSAETQVTYNELLTAHSILEEKDELLLSSKAQLRALLENTLQAFILVDKDYRVLNFNQRAVELHATLYQKQLKPEMSVIDSFSSEVLPILLPLLQQAARDGCSVKSKLSIQQAETPSWLHYDMIPVIGPDQQPLSIAISCLDITVQEESRQVLEKSHTLIDAIFNTTDIGMCLQDDKGLFLKANARFCDMFGYSKQEILGLHNWELVAPEQQQKVMQSNQEFLQSGSLPLQEWRVARKDGRFIDFCKSADLLVLPGGARYKFASYRDITDINKDRDLLLDTQKLTGIGGWEIDLSSGELHWTPQVYLIYGMSQDEPIDVEKALQSYLPASRARLESALQRTLEHGEPYDLELEFMPRNGKTSWIRATSRATRQNGKTIRVNGTFQDISQRRQARTELHKLSLVAQQIPNMVLITDADLRINFANPAYLRETGYTLDLLQQQTPLFLQGEQTDPGTLIQIQNALDQDRQVQEEILFYTQQGLPFWCELVITPVLDIAGQDPCYIVLQTNISERKRREELLLFQSDILAHVTDSVIACDLEGIVNYWNQGAENIYGYQAEEMLGQPLTLMSPEFDIKYFLSLYYSGNKLIEPNLEVQSQHKNGHVIWVSLTLEVIYNAEHIPLGVLGVSRDVTEKRETENTLRSSEETFRSLIEKSSDGIIVMSDEGTASYVSSAAERLLGYTADFLSSQDLVALVHPLDQPAVEASLTALDACPGKSSMLEYRFRHQNQNWIWVETVLRNMKQDPHLKGVIANFRDITQRKQTYHHLQQHEQLYRSISENFPSGMVMVLDQQLCCIFSEGQEKNTLIRRPEGQYYLDGFPLAVAEVLRGYLIQALAGQQQSFEIELQEEWYAFSMVPLGELLDDAERVSDNSNRVSRLLVVAQNITKTKQAVEEKNSLIQELTAKNVDLNQFTYIISHNLRSPVANLLGLINLMEIGNYIQSEGLSYFKHFSQTVKKLDDTILDLNQILSIRRHRDEISQVVDLNTELDRVLDSLSSDFSEIASWVQRDFAVTQFFSVSTYIQSMVFNLVSNAIKYRHPDRLPEIQVTSGRTAEHLWIAIEDNGLGLDTTLVQDKLFRLYMRFHPHIEGKGMGLYLIKTQAEVLGGGVEFSSELGQGTRFYIYFKESQPEKRDP